MRTRADSCGTFRFWCWFLLILTLREVPDPQAADDPVQISGVGEQLIQVELLHLLLLQQSLSSTGCRRHGGSSSRRRAASNSKKRPTIILLILVIIIQVKDQRCLLGVSSCSCEQQLRSGCHSLTEGFRLWRTTSQMEAVASHHSKHWWTTPTSRIIKGLCFTRTPTNTYSSNIR